MYEARQIGAEKFNQTEFRVRNLRFRQTCCRHMIVVYSKLNMTIAQLNDTTASRATIAEEIDTSDADEQVGVSVEHLLPGGQ